MNYFPNIFTIAVMPKIIAPPISKGLKANIKALKPPAALKAPSAAYKTETAKASNAALAAAILLRPNAAVKTAKVFAAFTNVSVFKTSENSLTPAIASAKLPIKSANTGTRPSPISIIIYHHLCNTIIYICNIITMYGGRAPLPSMDNLLLNVLFDE